MRTRKTHRSLSNSRIYQRRGRFYYFAAEPVLNPRTRKVAKWHSLCSVAEGIHRAQELAAEIRGKSSEGDLPVAVRAYLIGEISRRQAPTDAARLAMFKKNIADLTRQCNAVASAFAEFNVPDVQPVDVARFVDQWEGRRMAAVMKSRLQEFFKWAVRRGLRNDNPAQLVSVERPQRRMRYMTDDEFAAIRAASSPMTQCFMDLCYLTLQRPTEIRLLRWSDVQDNVIYFKPTKTEASSGTYVLTTITPAIREVLDRARALGKVKSLYVIHTHRGQPYGVFGIGSAWRRACAKAGVTDLTTRDIRAKAVTDARKGGYTLSQLKVAAAHTSETMTQVYEKLDSNRYESHVALVLPKGVK